MIIDLFRQGLSPQQIIYYLIIFLFALTLSFSVHEFMHAAVAVWLGDETPRNMGRLTLNPIAHVDPVGTILLLVAGFGWGKPVMYNPNRLSRFKSHRAMNIMVHLAGVTGNFILALISNILFILFSSLALKFTGAQIALNTVAEAFNYTYAFSMMLLAFNLLPIPPLDGFHVLEELLPYKVRSTEGYRKFQRFSPMIIWIVFIAGTFTNISILGYAVNIIETPFAWLINIICMPFYLLFQFMGL
ncbi:site-2 protease family protein [Butyrivibrio sp. AE2032]|uniref:site-2 protease family protein n=1 Tax=Butyrivibrio sp. AE2032 TaxID=1458463 RepID=UPI0006899528|nr:site-2 protease family protein [Butyrivibrio sp. AE2032]